MPRSDKNVTPPLPPRLGPDDFNAALGGAALYDLLLELDYELCRLAWLNCGAWDQSVKPLWVLKGGFAIRHTYQSERLSADVDVAPVEIRAHGQGLIKPPEIRSESNTKTRSGNSRRLKFSFPYIVGTERGTVWADLNTKRPVRLPPPVVRTFTSLFMDPFPVWVTSIEEIIREKSNGLLSFSYGGLNRMKDAFDLWYLLSNNHAVKLKKPDLVKALNQMYVNKRRGITCPTTDLGARFEIVLNNPRAETQWGNAVAPLLRGRAHIDFLKVRTELPELAGRDLV